MRKVILMMSVSLDGFFEGPDHGLGWQVIDDELHAHFNEELGAMGAFLDGRVTYELMAGFWPAADADPASTGPVADFGHCDTDRPGTARVVERGRGGSPERGRQHRWRRQHRRWRS